ncbi:tetratricopeptide repeat protein [Labrys monachus]|uniref:Tetratricopeptide (TPR) repeat protein n=1 Tax=Labrys monachus TaxID=217067 RepID=A0ABU0FN88_9HYPH|nr:tetratricopeptide repeat protein [Labrys monachus]MDQ0396086.1 tetratricopeptide (TPR) repeat protein [Labrys monachus]
MRFARFAHLFLIGLLALPASTMAQGRPGPDPALDHLYDRLAKAQSDKEARNIAIAIERAELQSGSDTADLLMDRALTALQASNPDAAIKLLSAIIHLRPGYAEAWNKRATAYFLKKDYTRSIADIAQTLSRNPREYGAWSGLGVMLSDLGDKKHAYEAFQKALAINPRLPGARKAFDQLRTDVEGRDI